MIEKTKLWVWPDDVLSSVRDEPVKTLQPFVKRRTGQAKGERFRFDRTGTISKPESTYAVSNRLDRRRINGRKSGPQHGEQRFQRFSV